MKETLHAAAVVGTLCLVSALALQGAMIRRSEPSSRYSFVLQLTMLVTIIIFLPTLLFAAHARLRQELGCNIALNIWGVVCSGLTLGVTLTRLRVPVRTLVVGGGIGTSLAVLGVIALGIAHPADVGCIDRSDVDNFSLFWWVIVVVHLIAMLGAGLSCLADLRPWPQPTVAATITLLASGFLCSTGYWVLTAIGLTAHQLDEQRIADSVAFPLMVVCFAGSAWIPVGEWALWWIRQTRRWREQWQLLLRVSSSRAAGPPAHLLARRWDRPDVVAHLLTIELVDRGWAGVGPGAHRDQRDHERSE